MSACVVHLGGVKPLEALSSDEATRTSATFDYTPKCGSLTAKALITRGWIEVAKGRKRPEYRIATDGKEILKRFRFILSTLEPKAASERSRRPIKPSPGLLKRYGGPDGAQRYAEYHERQAAYHVKIAARLRESLELYDGSTEQRRDEWQARIRSKR